MPHVFETAPTGRATCRGCGRAIAKGDVRFGERLPNPFREGDMTLWFHPTCAAYKRPEAILERLPESTLEDRETLIDLAERSLGHRRLPRLDRAARAPSGRARCRACRELIEKGAWRVALVYYEEGRFEPSGFIHVTCVERYVETADVWDRVRHFSTLTAEEEVEVQQLLADAPRFE